MDPITIASLVATIAGAAMKMQAAQEAQARQRRVLEEGQRRQRELQMQAEQRALKTAEEFAPEDRKASQDQIAEQITTELVTPVNESQAIRSQQSTTQGNVSEDYTTAKAASDLNSIKAAQKLAQLLGKTTSASRLRMGEAIKMMDTGQSIDQLGSFSRGQAGATQIGYQAAGQVDPGMEMVGTILQGAGSAGMSMGAGADLTSAGAATKYGTDFGSQQSSLLAAQEAGMGTGGLWNTAGSIGSNFKKLAGAYKNW